MIHDEPSSADKYDELDQDWLTYMVDYAVVTTDIRSKD